jgi:hypothetical protein
MKYLSPCSSKYVAGQLLLKFTASTVGFIMDKEMRIHNFDERNLYNSSIMICLESQFLLSSSWIIFTEECSSHCCSNNCLNEKNVWSLVPEGIWITPTEMGEGIRDQDDRRHTCHLSSSVGRDWVDKMDIASPLTATLICSASDWPCCIWLCCNWV